MTLEPQRLAARRASRSDLGPIAQLWRELIAHHSAERPVISAAVPALQLESLVRDPHRCAWIVECDQSTLGFCVAQIESAPAELAERCRALITELYVQPGARRRGLGRALVEASFDWARARGAARVEVRVAAANAEGQAFWRALGFGDFVDVLDRRL